MKINEDQRPFDKALLNRTRTQWQFGDWSSLTKLKAGEIEHHPERAKLALLAAAGHLQLGQNMEGRQFVRLAQEWGIDTGTCAQILVGGVYNSLARAAAIGNQQHRALQHFENAIKVGASGSDLRLLTQARINEQYHQLGLPAPTSFRPNLKTDADSAEIVLLTQTQEVFGQMADPQITDSFKVDQNILFHDLFYSLLRPLHPQGKALKRSSFFLLGPARTGKTLLAEKLQKEYGFAHLRLDEVFYTGKRRFPELPCDIASMVNYYAMLLKIHPTGLIIECDSLFLTPEPTRAADNIQILQRFMQELGLGKDNVYFIGNSAITPAAKAEQVIQFRNSNRCWTKNAKMEGEELLQYAKMWIDYSVAIKAAAEAQGLSYFEINPASFDEASTRAANAIMAGINHD